MTFDEGDTGRVPTSRDADRGRRRQPTKKVNLALQGGGAHGAFAWGVLDKILEDGRLEIEAISGTSAGAMNAVVVADGLRRGGPVRARAHLEDFWRAVSHAAMQSPIQRNVFDILFSNWNLDHNPAFLFLDVLSRMASPYQINPLNINPLKAVLAEHVDFGRIGQGDGPRIYVSATNVESGRARVFRDRGVTLDAVMASCCVPFIFQAVEIDGAPYWDGGYMGNPVIYPFIRESASADVLLVQINPIRRDGTPRTARDILNRSNEIAFNVSLLKELRLVDFINQAIRRGDLDQSDYREIFLHRVDGGEGLQGLSPSSKLNGEWLFLRHLRDLGRIAAGAWLKANFQFIGARGTLNVEPFYDEP